MSLDVGAASYRTTHTRPSFPARRRIATYFTGGVDGLLALSSALRQGGYRVHELAVDVRDGVTESSMVCTVMISDGGVEPLLDHLRALPPVVSSELL